jgi:hypothetical protein
MLSDTNAYIVISRKVNICQSEPVEDHSLHNSISAKVYGNAFRHAQRDMLIFTPKLLLSVSLSLSKTIFLNNTILTNLKRKRIMPNTDRERKYKLIQDFAPKIPLCPS